MDLENKENERDMISDEIDISRFLIATTQLNDFLEEFRLSGLTLFNSEDSQKLVLTDSSLLKEQTKNMINAAQQREKWINENMTVDELETEINKMNLCLKVAILELQLTDPELVENINNFNSLDLNEENLNRRTIGKLYAHWEDLFPRTFFGEFSVLKSKNDLAKLSSDILANDRRSIAFEQIRNIIDSPDVVKTFGTTTRTGNPESKTSSLYLPVIHCYHKQSGLNIMIKISDKTFVSGYALDTGQAIFKEFFEFVPPRVSNQRAFDDLIKENNPEKYFPLSFLKSKKPFIEWFLQRLSNKKISI